MFPWRLELFGWEVCKFYDYFSFTNHKTIKMKKFTLLFLLCTVSIHAQDLTWENAVNGDFIIDSITLNEPGGEGNIVNVSGKAGEWNVNMTFRFTNALRTNGQGEYTANAWAENGSEILTTTVRGVWKKQNKVYHLKHFENASDGSQLLTTGAMDLQNKTYTCVVRFLN